MSYPSLLWVLFAHKVPKIVWTDGFLGDRGGTGEGNTGQQVQYSDVIRLSVCLGSLIKDGQYILGDE